MAGMGSVAERLTVILVRARNPLNIGAAARAMTDFGVADLRVVSEYAVSFQSAVSAVDAGPVLEGARQFPALAEAVADCTLVYGTTALGARRLEHPVDLLAEAGERIVAAAGIHDAPLSGKADGKIALLFGSEKTGLSNEELSFCHRLLTIPMSRTGVSMNLGQAVAVCLYELTGRGAAAPRALPQPRTPATGDELARMEALWREVLQSSGYAQRFPGNMGADELRRVSRRLGMPGSDMPIWMGILRQIRWKLQGGDAEKKHQPYLPE